MKLQFLDAAGQPLAGATVMVAAAPGPILDLGRIADPAGTIDFAVDRAGDYAFRVAAVGGHQGEVRVRLAPGEAARSLRVE